MCQLGQWDDGTHVCGRGTFGCAVWVVHAAALGVCLGLFGVHHISHALNTVCCPVDLYLPSLTGQEHNVCPVIAGLYACFVIAGLVWIAFGVDCFWQDEMLCCMVGEAWPVLCLATMALYHGGFGRGTSNGVWPCYRLYL